MKLQNAELGKGGKFGGGRANGGGSFEAPSVQAPSSREIPTSKLQSHYLYDLRRGVFRNFEIFRVKPGPVYESYDNSTNLSFEIRRTSVLPARVGVEESGRRVGARGLQGGASR